MVNPDSHNAIPIIAKTGSKSSSGDKIPIIAVHAVSEEEVFWNTMENLK